MMSNRKLLLLTCSVLLPACSVNPPPVYDCANPPALSGLVEVEDALEGQYIVKNFVIIGAAAALVGSLHRRR